MQQAVRQQRRSNRFVASGNWRWQREKLIDARLQGGEHNCVRSVEPRYSHDFRAAAHDVVRQLVLGRTPGAPPEKKRELRSQI